MTTIPQDTQEILETLRKVAADTLERKRRLGHHAVIWRDGKPVALGEDAPDDLAMLYQNHNRDQGKRSQRGL